MDLKRAWNEIIFPLLICIIISLLTSIIECFNCIDFFKTASANDVFNAIVQIESFLFVAITTTITIRLNLIDVEIKKNKERFNEILDKYRYFGDTLFGEQFEKNYPLLLEKIDKKQKNITKEIDKDGFYSAELDKENAKFCIKKALPTLVKYRKEHFEAVKYLLILFLLILSLALIVMYIDFNCFCVFQKTIKTTIVLLTIYSIYKTYGAIKELFNHPFILEDFE